MTVNKQYTPDQEEAPDHSQSGLDPITRAAWRAEIEELRTNRQFALWYRERRGWEALPGVAKLPIVKWGWESIPALHSLEELRKIWYRREVDWISNIIVLTGRRSGIVVGDVDRKHGGRLSTLWKRGWPRNTVVTLSGSGRGFHVYVQCPEDGLPSISTYGPGVECKADGCVIVAPPSKHPDTKLKYRWMPGHAPWEIDVAPLPDSVIEEIRTMRPSLRMPVTWRGGETSIEGCWAYAPDEMVRKIQWLMVWAERRINPELDSREHRNNMAYRLGQQLGSLRLTEAEIAALMEMWSKGVRGGR